MLNNELLERYNNIGEEIVLLLVVDYKMVKNLDNYDLIFWIDYSKKYGKNKETNEYILTDILNKRLFK